MPPVVSVPLAILFYHLFKFLLGITVATPLFAGFVAGYLAYDTTLHAVHHFRLPGRLGRYLKKCHMRHHYLNPHKDFGVRSPLWDAVMGTSGSEVPT